MLMLWSMLWSMVNVMVPNIEFHWQHGRRRRIRTLAKGLLSSRRRLYEHRGKRHNRELYGMKTNCHGWKELSLFYCIRFTSWLVGVIWNIYFCSCVYFGIRFIPEGDTSMPKRALKLKTVVLSFQIFYSYLISFNKETKVPRAVVRLS